MNPITKLEELAAARQVEADARIALVIAKEDLRVAENISLGRRIKDGMLGKNEAERRMQIDEDTGGERNNFLAAEVEYIKAASSRETCSDSFSVLALLFKD